MGNIIIIDEYMDNNTLICEHRYLKTVIFK